MGIVAGLAGGARAETTLTLREALAIAMRENPRIHNACDGRASARHGRAIADSEFSVQFSPQASSGLANDTQTSQTSVFTLSKKFTYGTLVELSAGTTATQDRFYRSFSGVTLAQSLFRAFGPLANTARIADAERRIGSAGTQLQETQETVAMDVVETFYRVIGERSLLAILESSRSRAEHHLAASQARLRRALATRMDIYRAETQLAASHGALLESQEALQAAKDTLNILLARDLGEPIEPESEIVSVALPLTETELVETSLRGRGDLQEASESVRDAERSYRIAERTLYPDLRVGVNFSFIGTGDSFSKSTDLDDSGARFVVSGTNPLDRSAERAQAEQARLDLARRRRDFLQLRDRVAFEVRRAHHHLQTVERRIAVQEKNVEAAEANRELASLRFDRGYADTQELLQAEEMFSQAQRDEVALRIELVLASLKLRKTAGLFRPWVESLIAAAIDHCS